MKIINISGRSGRVKDEFILDVCNNLKERNIEVGVALFDCNCHSRSEMYQRFNIPVKNYNKDNFQHNIVFEKEFEYLRNWSDNKQLSILMIATDKKMKIDNEVADDELIYVQDKFDATDLLFSLIY